MKRQSRLICLGAPGQELPEPLCSMAHICVDDLDSLAEALAQNPGSIAAVRPGPPGPSLQEILAFLAGKGIAPPLFLLPPLPGAPSPSPSEARPETVNQAGLLARLMDVIPIPLFYKDAQGRYQGANEAFARFLGLDRKDLPGKTVFEVSPEDMAETYHRADMDLLKRGGTQAYEARAQNASGEVRDILYHKGVFVDSEGNPAGIVGVMTDVTEERLDRAMRQKLDRALLQAQKMEALGTLAGGVAHDVNNLLAPILGYAEMALEDVSEGSEAHENISEVIAAALRAKGLIRQILAFSRQELEVRVPVDITAIVLDSVELVRMSMPADIKLVSVINDGVGAVRADAVQVRQAILNLATNAWEAMEKTGGSLHIRLTKTDEAPCFAPDHSAPHGYARICVSDTGPGISPDLAARIFDPYVSSKEPGRGIGLGLSVVHGVMRHHEGCVEVEERKESGASLSLYFPLLSPDQAQEPLAAPEEQAADSGRNIRILIVDDDLPLGASLARMLKREGFVTTVKSDPVEALALFSRSPGAFDLAIVDYSMPRMTGDRLAAFLMENRPGFPVILTTGYSDRISPDSAKAMGIKDFLYKPLTREELINAIGRVCPKSARKD